MLEILNGKDDDCDGLEDEGFNDSDGWRWIVGLGRIPHPWNKPRDSDSDGDGIPDQQELEFGSNPL